MSSHFFSKVSFVNKISSIMKATSDDDKPIPGYVYKEISDITFESGDNCESCLDFLGDRLARDSTHVKLKVLKLMRFIVENGHPNFKLGLMKKAVTIKEATKYSGPPDPLHGNVPYVMVRQAAQSLSEILFNTDTDLLNARMSTPTAGPKHVSTGLGPHTSLHNTDKPRMEGFGNTPTQHNRSLGENIRDGLFQLAERLGEAPADHQRELLSQLASPSNYTPPVMAAATGKQMSPSPAPAAVRRKEVTPPRHVPGKAGGGWDDSDDDLDPSQPMSRSSESGSAGLAERLEYTNIEDWSTEDNLVRSYLDAGSVDTPLLTRSQLTAFTKQCANLSCDKVVEFLNARLRSQTDGAVMRALMLIEALMASDLVNLDRLTTVCRDNLVHVYNSSQGPPQAKARKDVVFDIPVSVPQEGSAIYISQDVSCGTVYKVADSGLLIAVAHVDLFKKLVTGWLVTDDGVDQACVIQLHIKKVMDVVAQPKLNATDKKMLARCRDVRFAQTRANMEQNGYRIEMRKDQLSSVLRREIGTSLGQRHKCRSFSMGLFIPDVDSVFLGLSPGCRTVRHSYAIGNLGELDKILGQQWDVRFMENITVFVTSVVFKLTKDYCVSAVVQSGQFYGHIVSGSYRTTLAAHLEELSLVSQPPNDTTADDQED